MDYVLEALAGIAGERFAVIWSVAGECFTSRLGPPARKACRNPLGDMVRAKRGGATVAQHRHDAPRLKPGA